MHQDTGSLHVRLLLQASLVSWLDALGGRDISRMYLGGEFPGHVDGFWLEVVAKAEVAQHLKEAVVACSHSHILQVIGAYAFLSCGGPVVLLFGLQHHATRLQRAGIWARDD